MLFSMGSVFRRMGVLPGILLAALALRLVLFTGIQGGDDAYYYVSAVRLMKGEALGPQDLIQTRIGYLAPLAAVFRLFGRTTAGLIVPALAASLSLVVLAWWLGRDLCSDAVGSLAAAAVALLPIDIFF